MATDVEICNVALSRIGIDQYIEDLTDARPAAVSCSLHLPLCRRQMLQDFFWPFASTVRQLALANAVTVPGWTYVYRYPVDCLAAHELTDEGGARFFRTAWEEYDYSSIDRVPYKVMGDPDTVGARILATDMAEAYLWYVKDVSDPNQLTELFRSALSWKIAAELALALKADAGRAKFSEEKYLYAVSQAQVHSLNEDASRPLVIPEAIKARY